MALTMCAASGIPINFPPGVTETINYPCTSLYSLTGTGNSLRLTRTLDNEDTSQNINFQFDLSTAEGNLHVGPITSIPYLPVKTIDYSSDTVIIGNIISDDSQINIISVRIPGRNFLQIYKKNINNSYDLVQEISGQSPGRNFYFGTALAISDNNDELFVGDHENQVVYWYLWDGFEFIFQSTITDFPGTDTQFGYSLAIGRNSLHLRLIVGGPSNIGQSSVIVLENTGTSWGLIRRLNAISDSPTFGYSVATDQIGRFVVVGDPGINSEMGMVYSYDVEAPNPLLQALAQNINSGQFGTSLSMSGDGRSLVIGRPQYIQGSDILMPGSVFVYSKDMNNLYIEEQQLSTVVNGITTFSRVSNSGETVSISKDASTIIVGSRDIILPFANNTTSYIIPSTATYYRKGDNDRWQSIYQNIIYGNTILNTIMYVSLNNNGSFSSIGSSSHARINQEQQPIITTEPVATLDPEGTNQLRVVYNTGPTMIRFIIPRSASANAGKFDIFYDFTFNTLFTQLISSTVTVSNQVRVSIGGIGMGISSPCNFSSGNGDDEDGIVCDCQTGGEPDPNDPNRIRAPTVCMRIDTTITGFDIAEALFTICDDEDYENFRAKCTRCNMHRFIPRDKIISSTFDEISPYIKCIVNGKGKSLLDKVTYLAVKYPDQKILFANVVIYAMAKYILAKALYGNFCIKYLTLSYNEKLMEDIGNSRFCRFLEFFECPQFADYEFLFKCKIPKKVPNRCG